MNEGDRCRAVDDLRVSVQYGEPSRRRLMQGAQTLAVFSQPAGGEL